MKDLKKTLRLAGIFCVLATFLSIGMLFLDIFVRAHTTFDIIIDAIDITLTVATAIVYFVFMTKSSNDIIQHRNVFMTLAFVNILNTLIVWVISFWVEIVVDRQARKQLVANAFQKYHENNQHNNQESGVVEDLETSIQKETLVNRLEELNKLRSKDLITEEEYKKLRQDAINKFLD